MGSYHGPLVSRKEFVLLLLNKSMTTFSYRSMLFVPPADGSKIARASQSPADALILDWEDGTALGDKPAARRATLEYLSGTSASKPVWVRLNPAGTAAFQDDIETLRKTVPPGLVLAKCTSVAEVLDLLTLLDRQCRLMPLIESASGLLASAEIARCSPQIAALGFGAEDFTASINAIQGPDERELLFARSTIVVVSRAAGIEPIDSPCLDYKDPEAVTTSTRLARRLGFSGKMAIHPAQLPR